MEYSASAARYDAMEYPRCGKSGLRLPKISLGLWHNFGAAASFENIRALCRTAFDAGITHFDLANNYGPPPGAAEENFGRVLQSDLAPYRDELLISTKAGYLMWPGPYGDWGSRKHLMASIDQSLRRLGLDHVDIFYHHRPDPQTPMEETADALADIVKSGKALYIGVSKYDGAQTAAMAKLLAARHCPFVINQSQYNIFDRTIEKNGVKSMVGAAGLGLIVFKPLAQGLLTGRYRSGIPADSRIRTDGRFLHEGDLTPGRLAQIEALHALADARGEPLAVMALAWCLRDPAVTSALIGASRPEQILQNCRALAAAPFTEEELAEIDRIALLGES